MSETTDLLNTRFEFGSTTVEILEGNILDPGVDIDAVVSTDDNYLTMGSGVAGALREIAGPCYVSAAQEQCPVKAGTVVVTKPYKLRRHLPTVRKVLHGTVIDYDTADLPLPQLVHQTTANCLQKADELGLRRILFPAFAAGSGNLEMEECAHQMCRAIKAYLAEERPLKSIYIILYRPDDPEKREKRKGLNESFIKEANLILGVPYNPALKTRQTRDFYGRTAALQKLEDVITGKVDGKKHASILGGPRIGKSALLDQLFNRAHRPGSALSDGRCVARVTFGRVHEKTPASFTYRKLLCSLGESEADPDIDTDQFLEFLEAYSDKYPQVLFLIDDLPRLLKMGAEDFWSDLGKLEERVRFVYTARDDVHYQHLLDRLSDTFQQGTEVIRLKCVEEQERERWVKQMYRRYLHRRPTKGELSFFKKQAGWHPYLISLLGYALIEAIKRDAIKNTEHHPTKYTKRTLRPFFHETREALEGPRRYFFDLLIGSSDADERLDLENLAKAVANEKEKLQLQGEKEDPKAMERLAKLWMEKPRLLLHRETLERLQARGYLIQADSRETAQFMADSFETYVTDFFGIGVPKDEDRRPRDVVITLLSPQPQQIMALFKGAGATIDLALRELLEEDKREFMDDFGKCIRHLKDPKEGADPGPYEDLEEVGNHILTQFATGAIKAYLQNLPSGSTISLMIDHTLKSIPWELMLEPAYVGEIPFRVGRSVVGKEPRRFKPPVRGDGKIKALLIGDPTDNIPRARDEVKELEEQLRKDGRFEPVVRIGSENCTRSRLLRDLGSGQYGLIHYSGHSKFDGYRSAWQLKDGHSITTNKLTSALQMQPPALVFSSSCESAEAGELGPIEYEFQTFDLASAFLEAGVEAYIGTLWKVGSSAAYEFGKAFYKIFLSGGSLGECMRQAKWVCREYEKLRLVSEDYPTPINWLAFILYGDPHIMPGDLFPALRKQEE